MIASSAADPLSEPACATRRRVDGCEWMLDTEPIERGKETLRRFDALNRGGIIAEHRPALSDQLQMFGAILEA